MDGLEELVKSLEKIEQFPTRYLTQAVKKAAQPILLQVQMAAPIGQTGNLIRALSLKMEKGKKGKRVFQIGFNKEFTDRLTRTTQKGKRYFYPMLQEVGYKKRNGQRKEGIKFIKNTADKNEGMFKNDVVNYMMSKIEKEWRK